jgi:hypothetical protein
MPKKWRGLTEGDEWGESRKKLDPSAKRFDEAFLWFAEHIATKPRVNTTPFLDEDRRILIANLPGIAELWIYFRIEPDDDTCTLLWLGSRGPRILFRVG